MATQKGPNPAVESLRLDLDSAVSNEAGDLARAAALDGQVAGIEGRLQELEGLKLDQRRLERGVEVGETRMRILSRRFEDAVAAEAFERGRTGNVRITQFASPGRPASSGRLLIMGAGVVLGLLAAGGLGVLRAMLRDTMLTPSEAIHRLGFPVLVAVPERS